MYRRTLCVLAGMFVLPAVLLGLLHSHDPRWVNPVTIGISVACGLCAVALSRWPLRVKVTVGVVYVVAGVPALLYLAFIAVCLTTDCLP